MNKRNISLPFEKSKIEIFLLNNNDIIVTSSDPFAGEYDEFDTPYYWEN